MSLWTRRATLDILATFSLGFGLAPSTAQAQSSNWEYSEELGGWLDWDTGLVWGEHSAVLGTGSWSYNGANKTYLPNYRAATGISAWRLPTRAEVEVAAAHGAASAMWPPSQHTLFYNGWTSTVRGRNSAYVANFQTGGGGYYSTKSYTNVVPVYRAFVP